MSTPIPESRKLWYKQLFDELDTDGSGQLDEEEVKQLLHSLGIRATDEYVSNLFASVDKDNSHTISFDEFLTATQSGDFDVVEQDILAQSFKNFDKEGSGYIRKESLRAVLHGYGLIATDEDLDAMMRYAAPKTPDCITFEDFVSLTRRLFPEGHDPRPKWL